MKSLILGRCRCGGNITALGLDDILCIPEKSELGLSTGYPQRRNAHIDDFGNCSTEQYSAKKNLGLYKSLPLLIINKKWQIDKTFGILGLANFVMSGK